MKKLLLLFSFVAIFLSTGTVFAERLDQSQFEEIVEETVSANPEIAEDKAIIEEKAQEIRALEERIDTITEKLSTLTKEEQTLEVYVEGISQRIVKNEEFISQTAKEIDVIQLEIEILTQEIENAEEDIEEKNRALENVLQEMYIRDQMTPLEITVGSDSLSSFFAQQEYTNGVRSEVDDLLQEVKKDKEEMEAKQQEQIQKKAALSLEKENLKNQQNLLEEDKKFKTGLLEETKNSEKKFQEILKNAEAEQARVNEEIATYERQVQEELASVRTATQEKLANDPNVELTEKEKLALTDAVSFIWPATGPITCEFHCADYPYESTIGPHSGTDLGISQGTPVKAAAAGQVTQVVYPVNSSLAYIVITHNGEFSSAYLHMSDISVSVNEFVQQGQVIGLSGGSAGSIGSGYSTGPHLHFEIRKNGLTVNPEDYLP